MALLPLLVELMFVALVFLLAGYASNLVALSLATILRRLVRLLGVPNPPRFSLTDLDVRLIHIATKIAIVATYLNSKYHYVVTIITHE